jgi:hypothetical protein
MYVSMVNIEKSSICRAFLTSATKCEKRIGGVSAAKHGGQQGRARVPDALPCWMFWALRGVASASRPS